MRTMQPIDLEYFLEICRAGSIAQAAAQLGVTQPALSKSLRRLEHIAGAKLCDRTARGVIPTEMGRFLVQRAGVVLGELDATKHGLQEMSGMRAGTVSLGVAPMLSHHFIPSITAQALQQRPGLYFRIAEGLFQELLPRLQQGELDFLLSSPLQNELLTADLHSELLGLNQFAACVGRQHPLADRQNITDDELIQYDWVLVSPRGILRTVLNRLFRERSLPVPEPRIETASPVLLKALLGQQNFISFLPLEVFAAEEQAGLISRLDVPWLSWKRELHILTRQQRTLSPAAQFIMDLIKEQATSQLLR